MARLITFLITLLLLLIPACGGGGHSVAHLEGTLTDPYGAVITSPIATISIDDTDVIGSPDSAGHFRLTAEPGTYTIVGIFSDVALGVRLVGKKKVTLVADQTLNIGIFELTNIDLLEGWARYNQGKYWQAEEFFLDYLDTVRSAQSDIGSASVYCALGWTRGQGQNRPVDAIADFDKAITGWSGNADAWTGLAGCQLSRMKSDGKFHFDDAIDAVNSAIDAAGTYSSAPTHDSINEIDLKAFRVLANYLQGNKQAARTEALNIQAEVDAAGSDASRDIIEVILAFTG